MATGGPGAAPRGRGSYRGPVDPVLREEWRRERRAVVRAHHPDRGGVGEAMRTRLDAVDARFERLEVPAERPVQPTLARAQPLGHLARRIQRRLRHLRRAGQARIPGGWPGHRRYFDL